MPQVFHHQPCGVSQVTGCCSFSLHPGFSTIVKHQEILDICTPSPKIKNSSHLQIDRWKTHFLLGRLIFRGELLVSGRIMTKKKQNCSLQSLKSGGDEFRLKKEQNVLGNTQLRQRMVPNLPRLSHDARLRTRWPRQSVRATWRSPPRSWDALEVVPGVRRLPWRNRMVFEGLLSYKVIRFHSQIQLAIFVWVERSVGFVWSFENVIFLMAPQKFVDKTHLFL